MLWPSALAWMAHFQPSRVSLNMGRATEVLLTLEDVAPATLQQPERYIFQLESVDAGVARLMDGNSSIRLERFSPETRDWNGPVHVEGLFLGQTKIRVLLVDRNNGSDTGQWSRDGQLEVKVLQPKRVIDSIFIGTVVLLMSLLYINFGAALNLQVLRDLIVRPTGPCVGLTLQAIGMPLLSYALGVFIFPDAPALQLGLFFTGISPSGGASNTWTAVLDGNINLSVLMTTVSNVAAFATMPIWLCTLGRLIFDRAELRGPYMKIASYCGALIVPLLVGVIIQKRSARITRVLVRLLKPISACLILFIVIFAVITKFYIFSFFSWQIVLAGMSLPGLGYLLAWLAAKLLHQNTADALTIAIETGIQNTGTAIFLLTTTLDEPEADLTTVVPVSVAMMTPLPLLGIYLYKRCIAPKAVNGTVPETQRIV
ncbi:hypothetical protein KR018_006036 [Drosophila ironensis]|nr:hypothetical protein KR018_006036 [Drosophila ironensis]